LDSTTKGIKFLEFALRPWDHFTVERDRAQAKLRENTDTCFTSNLKLVQPRHGYRFTADSVALAEFIRISQSQTLLDLCTGVGVVALLAWHLNPFRYAVGVELQSELAELARHNVRENHLSDKIFVVQGDVRALSLKESANFGAIPSAEKFDVISANPPFHKLGRGRINPNSQRAVARHEIQLTLLQLVKVCTHLLKPRGQFYLAHVPDRRQEILLALDNHGFRVRRMEYALPRKNRLLIEAVFHCS
jgi:tRNA1Val (adenine37-N6)-methyltransferase